MAWCFQRAYRRECAGSGCPSERGACRLSTVAVPDCNKGGIPSPTERSRPGRVSHPLRRAADWLRVLGIPVRSPKATYRGSTLLAPMEHLGSRRGDAARRRSGTKGRQEALIFLCGSVSSIRSAERTRRGRRRYIAIPSQYAASSRSIASIPSATVRIRSRLRMGASARNSNPRVSAMSSPKTKPWRRRSGRGLRRMPAADKRRNKRCSTS